MFTNDIDFFINGVIPDSSKTINTTTTEIGFIKGNMFSDEYIPYKNYQPNKLKAYTEQEELLLKISESEFALGDYSLYLDLHPNNQEIYNLFCEEVEKYKKYIAFYERNYGPLNLINNDYNDYVYYKNPWPWDNDGGVSYV